MDRFRSLLVCAAVLGLPLVGCASPLAEDDDEVIEESSDALSAAARGACSAQRPRVAAALSPMGSPHGPVTRSYYACVTPQSRVLCAPSGTPLAQERCGRCSHHRPLAVTCSPPR
jgi:hypothetical protein